MERYFEQFQTFLLTEKRVALNTVDAYCADIRHFLRFAVSIAPDRVPILADLKSYLALLKDEQLTSRSMARKIASLKAFYLYMHQCHGIENYAEHLVTPKIEQRLPRSMSEEEISTLIAVAAQDSSAQGMRNQVMVTLLYVSGMRISELTNLSVADIDFDAGMLAISGKEGAKRLVPVPQTTLSLLRDYCATIAVKNPRGLLFPVFYGGRVRPITRQACWLILKKLWEKTGIQKDISPHMLRHSRAAHLLKQGADARSVQQLLGHEQLTTVQAYTHVEMAYLRSIYDKKHPRS